MTLQSQVTNMEEIIRKRAEFTFKTIGSNWTMFNFTDTGTYLYNKRTGAAYKYWRTPLGDEPFRHGFSQTRMTPLKELECFLAVPLAF